VLRRLMFRVGGSNRYGIEFVDRKAGVPLVQWSKPALVAGAFGAAFVVASGVFFVETLLQTPPASPPMVAETTGRAAPQLAQIAQEPAAIQPADPADCQTQTWPHIARPCLSSEQETRGVRMITTDKLTEPAISVIEKPPANVIHPMPPPPRAPLFAANATPPLSGPALNAIAFTGRFEGTPATEKFETAAAARPAPNEAKPEPNEAKPEKPVAQKSVARKPVKQKTKRQIARLNDKPKSKPVAVTSRDDSASATNRSSFSGTQNGLFSGGPFGALFRN